MRKRKEKREKGMGSRERREKRGGEWGGREREIDIVVKYVLMSKKRRMNNVE